jgi:RES domain-containing protein
MDVYRVSSSRYVRDLTGTGARLYGGRWNQKGTAVVYASETRSLAVLEYLVHVPLSLVPAGVRIATITIPDGIFEKRVSLAVTTLPKIWRSYPAPSHLADLGTAWAKKNETLLLRVPSAIVEHEFNILISPAHPDMKRITVSHVEEFRIDERLLRPKKA